MAQKILIMGESGTGKSTSLRNCDPATTVVVNPVGKPLPFKNKIPTFDNVVDARNICKYMREQAEAGKKLIVVDDFQYILAVPYMNRIKESGWDKYNDFGANYFEIIDICKELPNDVIVVYLTHLETLDTGLTTVKLIGKLLREKITIEGLFTIVLRTGVSEGKYYFYTQNSGKDTVKSPMGMFANYAIDNDLQYVVDKVRNYYELGDFKSDEEMEQADKEAAAEEVKKPAGRRGRKSTATDEEKPKTRKRKTHDEVVEENKEKVADYVETVADKVTEKADGAEELPFEETAEIMDNVPAPETETPPRRTRAERQETLTEDKYYYIPSEDNYIMKHAGDMDKVPDDAKEITKAEFVEGGKRLSTQNDTEEKPKTRRTRRVRQ